MDARITTQQAGLHVGPDGRLIGLEERFDDHVGWAYRFGMVDNWEVFRCELHATLTIVCGLDDPRIDLDDLDAVARLGQRHRDLELVLEQARAAAEPAQDWAGCYDAIWELTGGCGLLEIEPGTPAPHGHAPVADPGDGLPDRMVDWMLRTMFQRDMAEVARTAPIGNWSRLMPVLHRQLTGTWALETRWTQRTEREHRQHVATPQQHLQVLLATAQQHFDPATDWEAFREYPWLAHDWVSMLHSARPARRVNIHPGGFQPLLTVDASGRMGRDALGSKQRCTARSGAG